MDSTAATNAPDPMSDNGQAAPEGSGYGEDSSVDPETLRFGAASSDTPDSTIAPPPISDSDPAPSKGSMEAQQSQSRDADSLKSQTQRDQTADAIATTPSGGITAASPSQP